MSGVDLNKVLLAVFTTLLVVLLIGNVVNELSHKKHLEHNAYAVVIPDRPAGGAATAPAAPVLEPVVPLLASADLADGQSIAKKRCGTCHTFNDGGKKLTGPNLWGIVGKAKGATSGFSYSDGMKEKGGDWSYADLNAFLANPKSFINKTKMNFAGFKKVGDRAAVIAYLRQQSGSPVPLP